MLKAATVVTALLLFAAATLLSSVPSVPAAPSPTAETVRRARGAALELALVLAADGTPRRVQLSRLDLEASGALIGHGLDWVRVQPIIAGDAFVASASVRLAEGTWLNIRALTAPGAQAFPDVALRIGAWSLPPAVVRTALRVADHLARWRGHALPPATSMVRDVAVDANGVAATLAVPRGLFRFARDLIGTSRPPLDPALIEASYHRLAAARLRDGAPVAAALQLAFGNRPAGVDAADANRANLIALAMYAVSPAAQRLGGSDVEIEPAGAVTALQLGGRPDLAKHFILSAALAATLDPGFTRAVGEWKELDDSLPGGSGFSFVDLTADRAGLHLARAAIDPATADAVARRLSRADADELFPSAAHRLAEGLSEAEFSRRYGNLDTLTYAEAIRRVDRLLARLPLYAPYVSN